MKASKPTYGLNRKVTSPQNIVDVHCPDHCTNSPVNLSNVDLLAWTYVLALIIALIGVVFGIYVLMT